MNKKIISVVGQVSVVLVTLFLFASLTVYFSTYDIMSNCEGQDDFYWAEPGALHGEEMVILVFGVLHLFVIAMPFFLYFKKLEGKRGILDYFILPLYDIKEWKVASVVLSLAFTYLYVRYTLAFWFSYYITQMIEMYAYETGVHFVSTCTMLTWPLFILLGIIHEIIYLLPSKHKNNKIDSNQ